MKKIIAWIIIFILTILFFCPIVYAGDYLNVSIKKPISDISQAEQFLKDRHASEEIYQYLPFIYDYCDKMNVNEVLVITLASIETGYFKSHLWKNNNNPGGIKSKNGWAKFDDPKDGFKYMINLFATYAGTYNKDSWIYGKAKKIPQLGNYYWCENSVDAGYTKLLISQMRILMSYKNEVKEVEEIKETTQAETILKNAIEKEKKLTPQEFLMSFTKNKKKDGLSLIYDAIK